MHAHDPVARRPVPRPDRDRPVRGRGCAVRLVAHVPLVLPRFRIRPGSRGASRRDLVDEGGPGGARPPRSRDPPRLRLLAAPARVAADAGLDAGRGRRGRDDARSRVHPPGGRDQRPHPVDSLASDRPRGGRDGRDRRRAPPTPAVRLGSERGLLRGRVEPRRGRGVVGAPPRDARADGRGHRAQTAPRYPTRRSRQPGPDLVARGCVHTGRRHARPGDASPVPAGRGVHHPALVRRAGRRTGRWAAYRTGAPPA